LPVVAAALGGILIYANRQNAWLTEPTPEAFAAMIKSAVSDAALRREKAARGRKTAQEFAWSRVTERYFLLYDRLYARFQDQRTGGILGQKDPDAVRTGAGNYAAA